jgi:hypothetical protein
MVRRPRPVVRDDAIAGPAADRPIPRACHRLSCGFRTACLARNSLSTAGSTSESSAQRGEPRRPNRRLKALLNAVTVHYRDRIEAATKGASRPPTQTIRVSSLVRRHPRPGGYGPVPALGVDSTKYWLCACCQTCRAERGTGRCAPVLKGACSTRLGSDEALLPFPDPTGNDQETSRRHP